MRCQNSLHQPEGAAEASMGVDADDFDEDGDDDIFITHIMEETNTLYVNDGTGLFEDRTGAAGLASISLSIFHDGTSRPLAMTVVGLLCVAGVAYGLASGKGNRTAKSN